MHRWGMPKVYFLYRTLRKNVIVDNCGRFVPDMDYHVDSVHVTKDWLCK